MCVMRTCVCGGLARIRRVAFAQVQALATMPVSLKGLEQEWEASAEVRDQVRTHGCLFAPCDGADGVQFTVNCGAKNYHVLAPLPKRLLDEERCVGQLHIPLIKAQIFCCNNYCIHFLKLLNLYLSKPPTSSLELRFPHVISFIRVHAFYILMQLPVPNGKLFKKEAKVAKQFTVLIKRKLQRDQLCRSVMFRRLMALVFDPEEQE